MAMLNIEIELELEGTIRNGDEAVGEFGQYVADASISSVSVSKSERPFGGIKWVFTYSDLLEGLDAKSADIVKANIMKAFHDEIDQAILEDAAT